MKFFGGNVRHVFYFKKENKKYIWSNVPWNLAMGSWFFWIERLVVKVCVAAMLHKGVGI